MLMMNDSAIYLRSLLVGDCFILKDIIGVYIIHNNNISTNLSSDFIIKNLDEKVWVKETSLKTNRINNVNVWMFEQTLLTLKYYILGNTIHIKDLWNVFLWINRNIKKYKFIIYNRVIKWLILSKFN